MPAHVHTSRCHVAHGPDCEPGCTRPLCNRQRDSGWHAIWEGKRPEDGKVMRKAVIVLLGVFSTAVSALALELKASHELSAQLVTTVTVTNEKVAGALDRLADRMGEKTAEQIAFEQFVTGAATGHLSCPPCVYKPSPCPPPLPCPPAQVYVQQAPLPTGPSAGGKRP